MVSIFSEYIWVSGWGADLFPLNVLEYFKKEHHNIILGNQKYCKQIGELKRLV